MQNLKTKLRNSLKGAERIAVLGIGSELMCDDAAGVLVASELEGDQSEKFRVFCGCASPESITGEIKKFKPTHLIIVDAADLGAIPGSCRMISPEEIGGVSFSTHRLPTKILADYLKMETGCEIVIMGIQPKRLIFCESVTEEVQVGVKELARLIKEALCE